MCSYFDGIFKHIGVKAWAHAMAFSFQKKFKNDQKKHETLLDLMSFHQDDVVKKLAYLTKVWTHTPHKPEQLTGRSVVSRGNNACLMANGR